METCETYGLTRLPTKRGEKAKRERKSGGRGSAAFTEEQNEDSLSLWTEKNPGLPQWRLCAEREQKNDRAAAKYMQDTARVNWTIQHNDVHKCCLRLLV